MGNLSRENKEHDIIKIIQASTAYGSFDHHFQPWHGERRFQGIQPSLGSEVAGISSSAAFFWFICLKGECFPARKWFSMPIMYE